MYKNKDTTPKDSDTPIVENETLTYILTYVKEELNFYDNFDESDDDQIRELQKVYDQICTLCDMATTLKQISLNEADACRSQLLDRFGEYIQV